MKTIFAIFSVQNAPGVAAALAEKYPNDHLAVSPDEWLVADEGTSQTVYARLTGQAFDDPRPSPIGGLLVVSIASYWGNKPAVIWEWIRAKKGTA